MSPKQAPRPALVTVAEAARQLSMDPRDVYRLVYNDQLPCVRIPSRNGNGKGPIRIEQAELDDFIRRCRQPAAT